RRGWLYRRPWSSVQTPRGFMRETDTLDGRTGMRMRLAIRVFVWAPVAAALLFAQGGNRRWWAWPADPDPASADRGRVEFAQACGDCHAPNATGTAKGPDLIRS